MLNQPCVSEITSTWSCCMIIFIHSVFLKICLWKTFKNWDIPHIYFGHTWRRLDIPGLITSHGNNLWELSKCCCSPPPHNPCNSLMLYVQILHSFTSPASDGLKHTPALEIVGGDPSADLTWPLCCLNLCILLRLLIPLHLWPYFLLILFPFFLHASLMDLPLIIF